MLNIIGCIDKPSRGDYILKGNRIDNYTEAQMAEIRNKTFGYVMQNYGLITYRNVYDNVSVPLFWNKRVKNKEYRDKIEYALKCVSMENYKNKYIDELSGGEKQRVAIARAIVNEPDIILADEPTGALDWENKKIIVDLLFDMCKKGVTLIMVTHDLSVTDRFNRHFAFENDGTLRKMERIY